MKEKLIQLLLKYIPWLAKKIWPSLKNSILRNTPPEIIAFRNEAANNNLLVFIHGFSGDAATTFGNIPEYLKADEKLKGWDIFSVGYSTDPMPNIGIGIWAASPDITKLSKFLITQIKNPFSRYKRIAIIAHSMGGLVVQRAILDLEQEHRNRITCVMLYGTPSNGLVKARLARWWNRQLRDMGTGGEFIINLRSQWSKTFPDKYPFEFKVVAGTDDEFVPETSSQACFDKKYCEVVSGNHLTIVKPDNTNHAGYQLLLSTLCKVPFKNITAKDEEVNLMLGNYNEVVNRLLPDAALIDGKGTTRLVFALEGLGRKKEAEEVLSNFLNRPGEKNTDIMGIMGGRYKRAFLDSYKTTDAEDATNYYSEALIISKSKPDDSPQKQQQIFYHAINLAFLSLFYKNDTVAMEDYANQAKAAAEKCPAEKWQYATIAEASIYKRDLETAEANYRRAAVDANVRERESIYTNAYMAYSTLYNTENENDGFITFLRKTLLK